MTSESTAGDSMLSAAGAGESRFSQNDFQVQNNVIRINRRCAVIGTICNARSRGALSRVFFLLAALRIVCK